MAERKKSLSLSFRSLLMAILLGLIFSTTLLIGVTSFHSSARTVNELGGTIVHQTLRLAETHIQHLLQTALQENAINVKLSDADHLSSANFAPLFDQIAERFEVHAGLSYVGLAIEKTGEYCMLERLPDGSIRLREYVDDSAGRRVIRDYQIHGRKRVFQREQENDGYDPRTRPFYQLAKACGGPVWTDSYAFWKGNERGEVPGLTHASPLFDSSGRLAGMWDVDFDIESLSAFLRSLKAEVPGYAFVIERRRDGTGRMLAHPDGVRDPGQPSQSPDAWPDAAAREVVRRQIDKGSGGAIEFSAGGMNYLAGSKKLSGVDMPDWLIGMVLDRDRVMAGVYANQRWSFMIFLSGTALALIAAFGVSQLAAKPLRALQREAEAIGRLELQSGRAVPSHIREIDHLAGAVSEMKTNLRSFRKYVPADVVSDLVRSGLEAELGGRTEIVSIYFSDIEHFTNTSEHMTPEELVKHLGEYLGAMTDGIERFGGTVDKFIGDAIMAFWNAPSTDPHHALHACQAALSNQRLLDSLSASWSEQGRPPFRTRVSVHTGEVVVGNIGSSQRLNYTVIGDSVNLASRLEKLNKIYRTSILISEATRLAAGPGIMARPVEAVTVRGKARDVVCYELVARSDDCTPAQRRLCELTERGFAASRAGEFAEAVAAYSAVLDLSPQDSVAAHLLARLSGIASQPA